MPDLYISPSRAAKKRTAQRFALEAANGLLTEGNLAADYAARMLRCLRNAGAKDQDLALLRDALSDTFGSVQGAIDRVLDDEGLAEDWHQIDLSEVL